MNFGVQVVNRRARAQVQFQTGMLGRLNLKSVADLLYLYPLRKLESDAEINTAFENRNGSDQLTTRCFGIFSEIRSRLQGKSVGKRNEAGMRQDLCNEHTGIRNIELVGSDRILWSDSK